MDTLIAWLLPLLQANPHIAALMALMAVCRTVFKPTCALIQLYVDSTANTWDNEEWQKIQASKGFKAGTWLLDLLTSIKVPSKDPAPDQK